MPIVRVGHRGAPREFPANTMRGFHRAVELGCEMVECDVRRAACGALVLAHDPIVADRNGRAFTVGNLTANALARLDLGAGEGVPELTVLTEWAAGRCAVMADMKCDDDGVEKAVEAALSPLGRDAKLVAGAGAASRARFRAIDSHLPLSLSLDALSSDHEFDILLAAADTEAVTWHFRLLTPARIEALHARGIQVYAWTVDDPAAMTQLAEFGTDGIISNRPDLLAGVG
ncbi:MAG TPA: glycerophosphodiester phosphodiesterase [Chthonomonadaceae bacterium]|nr:glycerophosphodiester phosphodiesterase [Chthonomonadaceae bacterium]